MLADRQQLDVRVAHLLAVVDQLVGQLAIGEPAVMRFAAAPPTAEMHLVDTRSACRAALPFARCSIHS